MRKLVVVINGAGGAGKDTICNIVSDYFPTHNISSISPIKQIAGVGGWQNEKTLAARKLLSDLKAAFTSYNDLPLKHLLSEYESFLKSADKILFVHIREGFEIERFLSYVTTDYTTLLIKRPNDIIPEFGNASDDCVEDFTYDYTYVNNSSLDNLEVDFMAFFNKIICSIEQGK